MYHKTKPNQIKECYFLTQSWEDKGFHTFTKVVCSKRLKFEFTYYDFGVQHFDSATSLQTSIILHNRRLKELFSNM